MNEDPQEIPISIDAQGAIFVNHAFVIVDNPDLKLVHVDCKSKYSHVLGYSSGTTLLLTADDNTLYLNETVSRDTVTSISFPSLEGWEIEMSNSGRYTIVLLFRRKDS